MKKSVQVINQTGTISF